MSSSAVLSRECEAYAPDFLELERRLSGEPDWLRQLRRGAFTGFQEAGFPGASDERWKYTSTSPIARVRWQNVREAPEAASDPAESAFFSSIRAELPAAPLRLVFVGGRWSHTLSSGRDALPAGVEVRSMAEVLRNDPDWLQPFLSRHASDERNPFTAWNTAFFEEGAFIRIAPDFSISRPIHLIFVSEGAPEPRVGHLRNLIVADRGSHSAIVERYVGGGDGAYLTNAVTEIVLEDGASVEHTKVQRESLSGFHVQTIAANVPRSARFTSHNVALGAALARTDLDAVLDGEGAECELNGLFVGGGSQHLDNHTFIDHAKPHGSSRELYKGVLDGRSRGVFHGTILVRKDAQKTDAIQTNKNLLLSRDALVQSTPALEIFADDVKCKHGSTIGQLDATAMFYLRSRGIGEEDARALLTWAFAEDVARRIRIPEVRSGVEAALGLRLPGVDAGGAGDVKGAGS